MFIVSLLSTLPVVEIRLEFALKMNCSFCGVCYIELKLILDFGRLRNFNHALILGSYITLIAINLGVFRPSNHNRHIACELEPLDMASLTRMGLVTRNGTFFEFVHAGRSPTRDAPFTSRPCHNNDSNEDRDSEEEESNAGDDEDKEEESVEEGEENNETIEQREETNMARPQPPPNPQQTTLDDVARTIAQIEANLISLFEHIGLTPRHPPTP